MAIESKNLLVWVKAMSRGQALPLDASEIYSSLEEAEAYASNSAIAYPGQTVKAMLEDGKYHNYTLQPSDDGYVLEEIGANGDSSGKQYVQVVDTLPTSGQIEGVLYILKKTVDNVDSYTEGYIWIDNTWKKVFWDMVPTTTPSGDSTHAIIDVVELPTENINEDVFYRLLTGSFVTQQEVQNKWVCHMVDALPNTGEPAFAGDLSDTQSVVVTAYYVTSDSSVMAYVPAELAGLFGAPVGWYPVSVLMNAVGYTFSGIITDILDDPMDGTFRLLLEYVIWQYKGAWTSLKPIGRAGTGANAETFNHPANMATGINSHAEGYYSRAVGCSQHVQGEYNAIDPEYDPNSPNTRAKYAHIVGNGTDDSNRSNAHTLDWKGVGWFAGGLKIGGTGQDDVNAKEVATKFTTDETLTLSADGVLSVNTTNMAEQDNTLPITSAGVYATVGNIEALLKTI